MCEEANEPGLFFSAPACRFLLISRQEACEEVENSPPDDGTANVPADAVCVAKTSSGEGGAHRKACERAFELADRAVSLGAGTLRLWLPEGLEASEPGEQAPVLLLFEKDDFFGSESYESRAPEASRRFLLPSSARILAASRRLIFAAPQELVRQCALGTSAQSDFYFCAVLFSQASTGLEDVVTVLRQVGHDVSWVARTETRWAAESLEAGSRLLAGSILGVAQAATQSLKACDVRGMLPEGRFEVPGAAREVASGARVVSQSMASLAGDLAFHLASAVGHTAGELCRELPANSERWHEDLRVIGRSSLKAGAEVFQAVEAATGHVALGVAETSAEAVGHSCGNDAKEVFQDTVFAVANVLEVKHNLSGKGLAQLSALSSAKELAGAPVAEPRKETPSEPSDQRPTAEVSNWFLSVQCPLPSEDAVCDEEVARQATPEISEVALHDLDS
ncbi:CTTNBP2 [Symbiodinium sp. CCMP2592]|nr:CTTNBP2 [Symbiodinium sp. CCMP2592]